MLDSKQAHLICRKLSNIRKHYTSDSTQKHLNFRHMSNLWKIICVWFDTDAPYSEEMSNNKNIYVRIDNTNVKHCKHIGLVRRRRTLILGKCKHPEQKYIWFDTETPNFQANIYVWFDTGTPSFQKHVNNMNTYVWFDTGAPSCQKHI